MSNKKRISKANQLFPQPPSLPCKIIFRNALNGMSTIFYTREHTYILLLHASGRNFFLHLFCFRLYLPAKHFHILHSCYVYCLAHTASTPAPLLFALKHGLLPFRYSTSTPSTSSLNSKLPSPFQILVSLKLNSTKSS